MAQKAVDLSDEQIDKLLADAEARLAENSLQKAVVPTVNATAPATAKPSVAKDAIANLTGTRAEKLSVRVARLSKGDQKVRI